MTKNKNKKSLYEFNFKYYRHWTFKSCCKTVDMVSGTSKGIEAVIIAVSLASGVGVAIKLWVFFGGAF